jgi:hypothetical protein
MFNSRRKSIVWLCIDDGKQNLAKKTECVKKISVLLLFQLSNQRSRLQKINQKYQE